VLGRRDIGLVCFYLIEVLEMTNVERYDRQLRIWGEHGQKRLEEARVCLINASATGTESLKNLVLPGIGSFTVVDGAPCTDVDVVQNYFVSASAVRAGISRAECVASMLRALNPAVQGSYRVETVEDLGLNQDLKHFVLAYSVVVATQMPYGEALTSLADACWKCNVPLVIARSYGLLGFVRIVTREMFVEQSRNDMDPDLRIDEPFETLRQFASQFNLQELSDVDHAHVPFIVLLLQALDVWKTDNGGRLPSTRAERDKFKGILESWRRNSDERNFDEALKFSRSIHNHEIPSGTRELLEIWGKTSTSEIAKSLNAEFKVLVKALREFVENEGCGRLPLRGALPDMTSATDSYIGLQRLYQSKAEEDFQIFSSYVDRIADEAAIDRPEEGYVREFCRNAAFARCYRSKSVEQEINSKRYESINQVDQDDDFLQFYVLLRAADRFYAEHGRCPGASIDGVESDQLFEADMAQLHQFSSLVAVEIGLPSGFVKSDLVSEMTRFAGAELHSIASLLGGVVAQEVVKIISRQFIPLENTFIFNGIKCSSSTLSV